MELSQEDRIARGRFLALTLVRLGGVVILMLGIAVWQSDLVQVGGAPVLGISLFVMGLTETILLPRYLASRWRTPGEE